MKLMMLMTFTLISPFCFSKSSTQRCSESFSLEQLWTLQEAYDAGKDKDMGLALAAITWKESSAGLRLSRKDGEHWGMSSYGPFHILLKTAKNRRGCSSWNCRGVREKLLEDFQYSADLAIEELEYWNARLGNFRKALAAYNAGNAWRGSHGMSYSRDIMKKMDYLDQCVRL